jgi:deoxyribodipyrimidine photo-lyase
VQRPAIVLFTRDLRVDDNPALVDAVATGAPVVPLFVLDPRLLAGRRSRGAFLVGCLHALDDELRARGGRLVLRTGDPIEETARVAAATGASLIVVAGDVTAYAHRRLVRLRDALPHVEVRTTPGITVLEPGAVAPPDRTHYRVFTPFHRAWSAAPWRAPVDGPVRIDVPEEIASAPLPPAPSGTVGGWAVPGAGAGRERAAAFLADGLSLYTERRDLAACEGTSRLSPYLRFGCISPLRLALAAGDSAFTRQLAWRDFYAQVLAANPASRRDDLVPLRYAWSGDPMLAERWRAGETGFPIVDAGMRQLLAEGWMHNRVRMIVASFLTKNLDLDWRLGEAHFDAHLLDGDPANNVGGWQWVAGTGVDTRPGRMFNPWLQSSRFDPDGVYIRRYLPELRDAATPDLHEPGRLGGSLLAGGYPAPMVDHATTARRYRERFTR